MITEDLIAYIQSQARKNISQDTIKQRLQNAGWHLEDIDEAFRKLYPQTAPVAENIKSEPVTLPENTTIITPTTNIRPPLKREGPDPYRVLPGMDEPEAMKMKLNEDKPVSKAFIPQATPEVKVEPKVEAPILKPVFATSFKEANTQAKTPSYYIPSNSLFNKSTPAEAPKDTKEEPALNFDVMKPKFIEVPSSDLTSPVSSVSIPEISKVIPTKEVMKEEPVQNEFIPTLKPKVVSLESEYTKKVEPKQPEVVQEAVKKPVDQAQVTPVAKPLDKQVVQPKFANITKVTASDNVPRNALLHSYPQVLSNSTGINSEIFKKKRRHFVKWLVIILVVSLIAGGVFAVVKNYVKLPTVNFSFIKKDPKMLLANGPQALSNLKSYKIDTDAKLSMPLVANITNGLVSGEVIPSHDTDYISLHGSGSVNNTKQVSPAFDYLAIFKSSLFKNDIVSDVKHSSVGTFITTPDLTELLGKNAPPESTVNVDKGGFNALVNLFPENIQSKISRVNLDKLVSIGFPSYVTDESNAVFKDFISSSLVIEKDDEYIRGINSYHYILSANRQDTKKFMEGFASLFLSNLSDSDREIISEGLGAATFDTLEVWIGKDDGYLHQYKFIVTIPLSKLIGLNDRGIAGNTVSLEWKTTYYDFDQPNAIDFPQKSLNTNDFIKTLSDMKLKDYLTTFKNSAYIMHNALGTFGKRSNPNGSCTNPNPGSLFSPIGHNKGATVAVGDMASSINGILNITNGALSCYSTPDAWAMAVPLVSDPTHFVCVDSTDQSKILATPLSGTICK